jgi:hypothetical protein
VKVDLGSNYLALAEIFARDKRSSLLHKTVCLPELGSGQSVEQSGRSETPESVASIIKHY